MKFINDRQRKAVMAELSYLPNRFSLGFFDKDKNSALAEYKNINKKGSNKFALEPTIVEGLTGSKIYTDPYLEKPPFIILEGIPVESAETIILAGEGYKGKVGEKPVKEKARSEYLVGLPVYSHDNKEDRVSKDISYDINR